MSDLYPSLYVFVCTSYSHLLAHQIPLTLTNTHNPYLSLPITHTQYLSLPLTRTNAPHTYLSLTLTNSTLTRHAERERRRSLIKLRRQLGESDQIRNIDFIVFPSVFFY